MGKKFKFRNKWGLERISSCRELYTHLFIPLESGCQRGEVEVVELLLEAGAEVRGVAGRG